MAHDEADLLEKISELEHELAVKEAELHRYRLEMGKLNTSLEAMITRVNQELKYAQLMQKLATPVELPNIQGFEFSTKFIAGTRNGGDYFDIFEHEDKLKFGILVSSASGYSLSSLLLSFVIRISSQIEARKGLDAHKVLELIAQEIVPQITTEDSANLFYAVVDRRNFELQYCSVGEIDAFWQEHQSGQVHGLPIKFPPLSRSFNSKLSSETVSLGPRDRIILASEGLKFAQNAKGVKWGSQGILDAITRAPKSGVHDLRNEILYSNQRYSGKEDPSRDQTLIVTEVKDRVIKLATRNP